VRYLDSQHVAITLSFLDTLYRVARVNFPRLDPLEVAAALEALAIRIRNEEKANRESSEG
jgi:hypothetical protein